jgi:c-di-GMP-binding flagellar brake protein YcgR
MWPISGESAFNLELNRMSDKSAEIVHEAVARSVSAILSLPSAGMVRNHKSRFICACEGGILLQAPAEDRALIAELSRNKRPCVVSFRSGVNKVIFSTPIRRSEFGWRLNDHTTLDAVLLEFPSEIKVTQKRSDYRVEIPPHTEIAVRIWRLGKNDDLKAEPPPGSEVTAEVLDVSTGGIGVRLIGSEGEKPKISVEDRLRISLTFDGAGLIVEGRMRPPHVLPVGNTIVTGIKFNTMQDNLEDRRIGARLVRIVGDLQRRELRMAKLGLKNIA